MAIANLAIVPINRRSPHQKSTASNAIAVLFKEMANTSVLAKVKERLTAKSEKAIADKAIAIGSKVALKGGSALVQNLYFSEWTGEWQMDIWFKETLVKNVSVLKVV